MVIKKDFVGACENTFMYGMFHISTGAETGKLPLILNNYSTILLRKSHFNYAIEIKSRIQSDLQMQQRLQRL